MAPLLEALLPPSSLQYAPIPDGSDLSALLHSSFSLPAAPTAQTLTLLPESHVVLLFPGNGTALLCPPHTKPAPLSVESNCSLYAVRLQCGCGDWIWDCDLDSVSDFFLPLEPLFPGSDRLCQSLSCCTSLLEQNNLFTRFSVVRGGLNYQAAPLLRRCLTLIGDRHGQVRVSELAEYAGCSPRHLNRLMRQKVGLPTKTVCQLAQLHHSLHIMLTASSRSLLHLAVNCGYFDQAHMNRQYRQFLGCSAGDMRRLIDQLHPQ